MSEIREVKDLDILRPKANIIKLGDEEIDISYVPTGITFEVDELLEKINEKASNQEELLNNRDLIKEVYDLSIDLCVLFCSRKHSKLNKDWFLDETNPVMVRAFVDSIKVALNNSYEGVRLYGKNA